MTSSLLKLSDKGNLFSKNLNENWNVKSKMRSLKTWKSYAVVEAKKAATKHKRTTDFILNVVVLLLELSSINDLSETNSAFYIPIIGFLESSNKQTISNAIKSSEVFEQNVEFVRMKCFTR